MMAEQMWALSGLEGEYEAWQFGSDPDGLAKLVLSGVKTATSSAYDLYIKDGEPVPRTGDYSVILNSSDEAVCVIRDTDVYTYVRMTKPVKDRLISKAKGTGRLSTGDRSTSPSSRTR